MSYLVLARKFRPQTFASIVGQDHITRALANAILYNRVPHALLFTGPRGVGKTTSARVLARALNCTGRPLPEPSAVQAGAIPGGASASGKDQALTELVEPCGECSNCKEIARSASIAVWEIDGASNNSVDNVRDLIDSLRSLPPPGCRYKIYIIDEVHMLSVAAFNALLKSLEEPPPNTIFIFATTEPQKIPETVISRCQRHDFRRLPVRIIVETLEQLAAAEGVALEEGVSEFIALKARGGMRDAQSMLDRLISFSVGTLSLADAHQVFGVVDSSFYSTLSGAVLDQNVEAALEQIAHAFGQSLDVRAFLAEFLLHWRNLLLVAFRKGASPAKLAEILEISERDCRVLVGQIEGREPFDLQRLFDIAERTVETALTSTFPRFVFEAGVVKMATLPDLRPLGRILADLEQGGGIVARSGSPSSVGASSRASAPVPATPPSQSRQGKTEISERSSSTPSSGNQSSNTVAPAVPESSGEAETSTGAGFNPSWQDFIQFLRGRNEIMLATFLRRVSASVFLDGRLTIEGSSFDVDSLKDAGMMESLKTALIAYSEISPWEIRLSVYADPRSVDSRSLDSRPVDSRSGDSKQRDSGHGEPRPSEARAEASGDGVRGRGNPQPRRANAPAPGSVAMLEAKVERERISRVDHEARNDPFVKEALSLFEGSSVERVAVFKKEP